MSEMKLIMEGWRTFQLAEASPEFKPKEDPQDTMDLLKALSTERDEAKVQKVLQRLLADKEIAKVLEALSDMFQEITDEEEVEVVEGLDDLPIAAWGVGMNFRDKVGEFLESSPTGRALKTVSPSLLGIALGVLMWQSGEVSQGGLKTVGKLVSGGVTSETLGDAVADLGAEALEAIQERKRA